MGRRTGVGFIAFCLVTLLALALVACSSATPGSDYNNSGGATGGTSVETTNEATTIVEQNLEFFPSELTVNVGDVVTFSNIDSVAHDVSVDGEPLGSQAPGASVTWTASTTGTFPVKCLIHPSMTGQIVVK